METTNLTPAEVNHLRLLLGWAACEIGQSPEEFVTTVRSIAPQIQDISQEGKARLVQHHATASNVPKYVRAAVKALRKTLDRVRAETFVREVVEKDFRQGISDSQVRELARKVMAALPAPKAD
jgi:hypothetical protein